ncbi:CBS-domain-containing membrane protein [Amycolatopsis magusensis]|uniref:CBS-domain-containing membrane protein n=1 Tax=Amycolatopsis magusensis TaxID=882444 RepID=A0ABS4PW94_9PSEU|nr:CBS-domain-containing membrane protein [Amycolatopsis magusensis]
MTRILAGNEVTALPVVDGDDAEEVAGIVSEADLLPKQFRPEGPSWRVLFSPRREKAAGRVAAVSRPDLIRVFVRTDAELHDEIVHEVFERALCQPSPAGVSVKDGVVTLGGRLSARACCLWPFR